MTNEKAVAIAAIIVVALYITGIVFVNASSDNKIKALQSQLTNYSSKRDDLMKKEITLNSVRETVSNQFVNETDKKKKEELARLLKETKKQQLAKQASDLILAEHEKIAKLEQQLAELKNQAAVEAYQDYKRHYFQMQQVEPGSEIPPYVPPAPAEFAAAQPSTATNPKPASAPNPTQTPSPVNAPTTAPVVTPTPAPVVTPAPIVKPTQTPAPVVAPPPAPKPVVSPPPAPIPVTKAS